MTRSVDGFTKLDYIPVYFYINREFGFDNPEFEDIEPPIRYDFANVRVVGGNPSMLTCELCTGDSNDGFRFEQPKADFDQLTIVQFCPICVGTVVLSGVWVKDGLSPMEVWECTDMHCEYTDEIYWGMNWKDYEDTSE